MVDFADEQQDDIDPCEAMAAVLNEAMRDAAVFSPPKKRKRSLGLARGASSEALRGARLVTGGISE